MSIDERPRIPGADTHGYRLSPRWGSRCGYLGALACQVLQPLATDCRPVGAQEDDIRALSHYARRAPKAVKPTDEQSIVPPISISLIKWRKAGRSIVVLV